MLKRILRFHKQIGSTYKPEELVEFDAKKYEQGMPKLPFDIFKAMKTDPLKMYKDVGLLKQFQQEDGGIVPRFMSGLTKENQKKLAKAIKRARHFGLMSFTAPK